MPLLPLRPGSITKLADSGQPGQAAQHEPVAAALLQRGGGDGEDGFGVDGPDHGGVDDGGGGGGGGSW